MTLSDDLETNTFTMTQWRRRICGHFWGPTIPNQTKWKHLQNQNKRKQKTIYTPKWFYMTRNVMQRHYFVEKNWFLLSFGKKMYHAGKNKRRFFTKFFNKKNYSQEFWKIFSDHFYATFQNIKMKTKPAKRCAQIHSAWHLLI